MTFSLLSTCLGLKMKLECSTGHFKKRNRVCILWFSSICLFQAYYRFQKVLNNSFSFLTTRVGIHVNEIAACCKIVIRKIDYLDDFAAILPS